MTTKGYVALGTCIVVLLAGVVVSATYEHGRAVGKRCIVCHDTITPSLDDLNAAAAYYLENGTLDGYEETGTAAEVSGEAIYKEACAGCHGAAGQGALVGKAINGALEHGSTPAEVAAVVAGGIKETTMIGFRSQLTPKQIKAVASHVVSLKQAQ